MPRPKPPYEMKLKAFRIPVPLLDAVNTWRREEQAQQGERMSETAAVLALVRRGLETVERDQRP